MRVQSWNVRRCDTKAFMKAICDDNNICLDGQFGALPYLLEKWSASLKKHVCCELETGSAQWH